MPKITQQPAAEPWSPESQLSALSTSAALGLFLNNFHPLVNPGSAPPVLATAGALAEAAHRRSLRHHGRQSRAHWLGGCKAKRWTCGSFPWGLPALPASALARVEISLIGASARKSALVVRAEWG